MANSRHAMFMSLYNGCIQIVGHVATSIIHGALSKWYYQFICKRPRDGRISQERIPTQRENWENIHQIWCMTPNGLTEKTFTVGQHPLGVKVSPALKLLNILQEDAF